MTVTVTESALVFLRDPANAPTEPLPVMLLPLTVTSSNLEPSSAAPTKPPALVALTVIVPVMFAVQFSTVPIFTPMMPPAFVPAVTVAFAETVASQWLTMPLLTPIRRPAVVSAVTLESFATVTSTLVTVPLLMPASIPALSTSGLP